MGARSRQNQADTQHVEIIGSVKPCRTCREITVKTEVLDEIENFSADDELHVEQERVKSEPTSEGNASRHENSSEATPESDCRRNASVSLGRRQMDGYTDLKKYIVLLTRGKLLMCSVCRIEFPNEAEFRVHMVVAHSHGKFFQHDQQFRKRPSTLRDRLHMHFIPKPLACRQCEFQFQREEHLEAKVPYSEAETFKDPLRGKQRQASGRQQYRRRQSPRGEPSAGNAQRSHECATCGKSFLRSSSLRTHMIVHTADLPYACDLCPAKFKRPSVLKTHKLTHTGVRRFECDICKHRFHLKGALKHHVLAHYGIRPYKCEDCGKSYRRSWGLKVHRYRHTGIKQFECDFCKLRFSVKTKLANHIYTHIGEKPYKCDTCGRQYGERYQLKAHRCTALSDNPLRRKAAQILFFQPKLSKHLVTSK